MKTDFSPSALRSFLVINPWFASLPEALQTALVEAGRTVSLAEGQWLFGEGDPLGGLWIVLSGTLRVFLSVGPERDVLFEIVEPGAVLAHPLGFEGRARMATVRASAEAVVLAVPNVQVQAISQAHPALANALAELYHAHVSHLMLVAAGALCLTPRGKVAGRLALITDNNLRDHQVAHVTQSDLAEMTGLSRKSVQGHLSALARMGIVEVVYGGVRILDPARLRAAATA
jgi:CRP/FNR family cyclic AMP-dependent transcriptional regulator